MSDHQNKTKQSHRFIVLSLLVIFILCVATAVRIYRLDRQSFWLDEAYTAQKADLSATEIIENFQKEDSNPPTYLIAIKVWKQIFPQSNFSLRMSSCIFGILSILMAYLFIREISGKKTAILVAALMAVSPYHLWYSHELRMYTMLCAVVLAALFCLVKAAKNGKQLYWAL